MAKLRPTLEIDKQFHPMHNKGCNYSFMLGLKLIHISKTNPMWRNDEQTIVIIGLGNGLSHAR